MTVLVVHNARIVTCPPWSPDSQQQQHHHKQQHQHQQPQQQQRQQQQQLRHFDWMICSGDEIYSVGHGTDVNRALLDAGLDSSNNEKVVFIDSESRIVIPGLWDSHCHIYSLARQRAVVADLTSANSIQEFQRVLRKKLASLEESKAVGPYLEGAMWDQELIGRTPNRKDCDAVSTAVPVICWRRCYHIVVANSKALEVCGVTSASAEEAEGVDLDSETGEPTGVLRENAVKLLQKLMSQEDSRAAKKGQLRKCLGKLGSVGLVGVQTNDSPTTTISDAWAVYSELAEEAEGRLPVRVALTEEITEHFDPNTKRPRPELIHPMPHSPMLFCDRVKIFTDGGLGASTAALLEPYSDDPAGKNRGILTITPEQLDIALDNAAEAGFRTETHCIGDAALDMILSGLERRLAKELAVKQDKLSSALYRPVLTHVQIANRELFQRIADLSNVLEERNCGPVICNIQPQFVKSDLPVVERMIGAKRAETSYAWKSLRDEGRAVLAGGSDAPVELCLPLRGMAEAMENALHEIQSVSLADALAMYTVNAAFACDQERRCGAIAPGYLADIVILDIQCEKTNPRDIEETLQMALQKPQFQANGVWKTFVGGKLVYSATEHRIVGDDPVAWILGDAPPDKIGEVWKGPGGSGRPRWLCPCCRPTAGMV